MKRTTKNFSFFLSITCTIFLLLGCSESFDSKKWNAGGLDWWVTDVREKMFCDLIESDTLIGLSRDELIRLLGKPEKTEKSDSNKLFILVREKYSFNIDPEYIKYLLVELDSNKQVCTVQEYQTK